MLSSDDVVDLLAIHLLGIIPEDKGVLISTNKGTPIALDDKSLAGQAYRNISRRILGENVPLLNLDKGSGFFNRISSVFGSGE
jgi:septum site-determining protein MinD